MSKPQKILTIASWGLLILATTAFVAYGVRRNRADESGFKPLFLAPDFSLIDQDGQPFTSDQLKGRVWIADFVFTNCGGPCPLVSSKMASLQKTLGAAGVHLVSFTVDPKNDTPAVLKKYGAQFNQDSKVWTFLTGKPEDVYAVAKAMKIAAIPAEANNPIIHSTKFVLIDTHAEIVGYFDGQDNDGIPALAVAATKLVQEEAR